jgi:peptide-methionine (S)-S-oxide reductase
MKAIRNVLIGLALLGVVVLVWDSLPFYAEDNPTAGQASLTQETDLATATFAGGCFWCMEKPFDDLEGVVSTTSGYTGGTVEDPTYYQVSAGDTGHVESVQVLYNPSQVSYDTLLDVFWKNVDPLDNAGQFCDKGSQYRSKIFVHNDEQRQLAEASKQELDQKKFRKSTIATEIESAQTFYPAEEYHQDYYLKHPIRYNYYRTGCGRDKRLEEVWGSKPH